MKVTTSFMYRLVLVCLGAFGAASPANAGNCKNDPQLKIDKHTLDFNGHKPVCLNLGTTTFTIKLITLGNFDLNYEKLTVVQKDGPGTIVKHGIDADGNLVVKIEGYSAGDEPRYKIKLEGVGELDPRVRISENLLSLKPNYAAIDNYLLNEYELNLAGLLQMDQYLRDEYDTNITEVLNTIREHERSSK